MATSLDLIWWRKWVTDKGTRFKRNSWLIQHAKGSQLRQTTRLLKDIYNFSYGLKF